MKILHLDSSINHEFSVTRQLSAEVVNALMQNGEAHQVIYRDLVKDPISHLTLDIASGFRPVPGGVAASPSTVSEHELSNLLVSEFLASEVVVIGAPMYNFSVSGQLKAWMDRIAQPGKTFSYTPSGPVGHAGGKAVIIVSARGGFYAGTPLEDMDNQERLLRTYFGFLGVTTIGCVRAEGASKSEEVKREEISRARFSIPAVIKAVTHCEE